MRAAQGVGGVVEIDGGDAEAFGHRGPVGRHLEARGVDALAVEQRLLLVPRPRGGVVQEDDLEIDALLGRGDQFLDVHLDRAVAGEADHGAVGFGGGRRRWPPGRRSPCCRGRRRSAIGGAGAGVGLGHPHLVLADVGGDDGVAVETGGHRLDEAEVGAGIVHVGHLKRPPGLQFRHPAAPRSALAGVDGGQQAARASPTSPAMAMWAVLILPSSAGSMSMWMIRAPRAELGDFARGPVVEAGADGDQEVAFVQGQVGRGGRRACPACRGKAGDRRAWRREP